MDIYGEYTFTIRSFDCGRGGEATLPAICNYLQEAANLHADALGISSYDFREAKNNLTWVITRMHIRMARFPKRNEEFKVLTFPRPGRKVAFYRDYIVTSADGERLGVATTEWVIIDLSTRRLAPITGDILEFANDVREPAFTTDAFTRFKYPEKEVGDGSGSESERSAESGRVEILAGRTHIDLNGHVNNVHYIEWLLETVPEGMPKELEIVFRTESFAGERMVSESCTGKDGIRYHRICGADGSTRIIAKTL